MYRVFTSKLSKRNVVVVVVDSLSQPFCSYNHSLLFYIYFNETNSRQEIARKFLFGQKCQECVLLLALPSTMVAVTTAATNQIII